MVDRQRFEEIRSKLTKTRAKVLNQLLAEKSYPEIAKNLEVAEGTLRKHVSMLFEDFQECFPDREPGDRFKLSDLINLFQEYNPELLSNQIAKTVPVTKVSPYVPHHSIEKFCYQELEEEGALLRIQAPPKMGKTLLLSRLINGSKEKGYRSVCINLRQTQAKNLRTVDQFLQWFCIYIAEELGIEISTLLVKEGVKSFPEYWDKIDKGNANQTCKEFFEKNLLSHELPLILGIDDIENIFPEKEIIVNFLSMIRSWHEDAKSNSSKFNNLRLILTYTEEYPFIDINLSPFNVGECVNLQELTEEQVEQLFYQHGVNNESTKIRQLMGLVGGNPYLINIAIKAVNRGVKTIDEIIQESANEGGVYGEYLRSQVLVFLSVIEKEEIISQEDKSVLKSILKGEYKDHIKTKRKLSLSFNSKIMTNLNRLGFIKWNKDCPEPQCKLYQEYFKRHW